MADDEGWIGQAPGNRMTEEDLRQWCADKNRFAERIGVDWWYKVIHADHPGGGKRWEVIKFEGFRAIEERARTKGYKFQKWWPKEGEAEEIHAKIAKLVAAGMTQAEFNKLVDEGKI